MEAYNIEREAVKGSGEPVKPERVFGTALSNAEIVTDLNVCLAQEVVFLLRELSSVGLKASSNYQRLCLRRDLLRALLNTVSPLLTSADLAKQKARLVEIENLITAAVVFYSRESYNIDDSEPRPLSAKPIMDVLERSLRRFVLEYFNGSFPANNKNQGAPLGVEERE